MAWFLDAAWLLTFVLASPSSPLWCHASARGKDMYGEDRALVETFR